MTEDQEKELAHYQKIFSLKDKDLAVSGYIAFVDFVRQQVDYISGFKLKDNIDGKKAETVVYDRAISIGESLPDMISKMNRLKAELKIDFDINSDKPKVGATNPQTIANLTSK